MGASTVHTCMRVCSVGVYVPIEYMYIHVYLCA